MAANSAAASGSAGGLRPQNVPAVPLAALRLAAGCGSLVADSAFAVVVPFTGVSGGAFMTVPEPHVCLLSLGCEHGCLVQAFLLTCKHFIASSDDAWRLLDPWQRLDPLLAIPAARVVAGLMTHTLDPW